MLLSLGGIGRIHGAPKTLAAPLAFLLLPLLQLLPVPTRILGWIDRESVQLISGGTASRPIFETLSLDPPSTLIALAKASACLAIFLAAGQAASVPRRSRNLFVRVVAISGLLALLIAIGHRIWGASLIYGRFGSSRPILNGPFVNPNHTAEFLELASFAGIASALTSGPRFQKILWTAGAVSCAAGALATLSRGSVLALSAGYGALVLVLVLAFARRDTHTNSGEPEISPRRRLSRIVWTATAVVSLSLLAISLGATAVIDRLTPSNLMSDIRFALWRDSFRMLQFHPFGIGAGAFDRVYPVYRSLTAVHPVRFSHVENQPLQWLLEFGWVGFAMLVVAGAISVKGFAVRSMTPSSLALAAGLLAVLVHNLVDFGLDLLGVSLPFWALAGTLAGRANRIESPRRSSPSIVVVTLFAALVAAISVPLLLSAPLRDFDALISRAKVPAERQELAIAAALVHPTDYYYPLVQAWATPMVPDAAGHFARLRALNRALQLCPGCPDVHVEVARGLWSLGRRKQALSEYRIASSIQPDMALALADEVWRRGRSAGDLRAYAGPNVSALLDICSYLLDHQEPVAASGVLAEAKTLGAPDGQLALLRGRAALLQGQNTAAEKLLSRARGLLPGDPRIDVYLAESMERNGKTDAALDVLDAALRRAPNDLGSARLRLSLLTQHKRWSQTEKALDAFKEALQNAQMATAEAHIAAARIYLEQARMTDALSEFQIASVQRPEDVDLLVEYARLADRAGRTNQALDLLTTVATLDPNNAGVLVLRQQIATRRREASERSYLGTDSPSRNQQ